MWYLDKIVELLSDTDKERLKSIYAPTIVGVPISSARRSICVMPDGEIRNYGFSIRKNVYGEDGEGVIYQSSRNGGLDWSFHQAPSDRVMGASTFIPHANKYITVFSDAYMGYSEQGTYCRISEIGPDDENPRIVKICEDNLSDTFQPVVLSDGKIIVTGHYQEENEYTPVVMTSKSDGDSWEILRLNPSPKHEFAYPHKGIRWQNNGAEPHVCEMANGTLMLMARTSLDYFYVYYSYDRGETWTSGEPSMFNGTLTSPYLLTLSDGRTLFFWNNARPLPELNHHEQEHLTLAELVKAGLCEDVFTNRDVNHVAITHDGIHWEGFREMGLNGIRNAPDFRTKGGNRFSADKSVHQFQAIELPYGKVLVAYGQHELSSKLVIFDPNWLYENERHEDWQLGMDGISTQLYVKSYSGSTLAQFGFSGHCAWNRTNGALLIPDPDFTGAEVLQIARVHDERLYSEVQGAVWNFPSGDVGEVKMTVRIQGAGIKVRLCDHWINPCDEYAGYYAIFDFELDERLLPKGVWCDVTIRFDVSCDAKVYCGDKLLFSVPLQYTPKHGISYLHLQTMAKTSDFKGTLIKHLDFVKK